MGIKQQVARFIVGVSVAALTIGSAVASVIPTSAMFQLNIADPASMLPAPANYGSVDLLLSEDQKAINVSVMLSTGYYFTNSGGPHFPFVFDLASGTTVSNIAPGSFLQSAGSSFTNTPWGDFNHAIDFTAEYLTTHKSAISDLQSLSFTVTKDGGGNIDLLAFMPGSLGYYFSADIGNKLTGKTGNVASTLSIDPIRRPNQVPEPSTIAVLGLGMLALCLTSRRKTK